MSPHRLEVSNHAKKRLKERGITRYQIRSTIEHGKAYGLDIRGRKIRTRSFGNRHLMVIYLSIPGGYLLITAYWR